MRVKRHVIQALNGTNCDPASIAVDLRQGAYLGYADFEFRDGPRRRCRKRKFDCRLRAIDTFSSGEADGHQEEPR